MRLEVITDSKTSAIYVLNRPEVYIGSAVTNDIVIKSPEISKKHLKLYVTEEKCIAVDQGSTNGSFINDERMIPGRREEFPVFSSIRLGDKVLLTLMDKDKGDGVPALPLREKFVEEKNIQLSDHDKTRVISLKQLQKAKTEKVKKKRLKTLEKEIKKKKQIRKDKATLNQAIMTSLVVVGLAWGAMHYWKLHKARKARQTIVGKLNEQVIIVDDNIESLFDQQDADERISDAQLLKGSEVAQHIDDVMCTLPEEIFFCKQIPKGPSRRNGVTKFNNNLIMFIEAKEWRQRALSLVEEFENSAEEVSAPAQNDEADEIADAPSLDALSSPASINKIAMLSFLKEHLSGNILPEYREFPLYVVFFEEIGDSKEILNIMAIKGNTLTKINRRYTDDFFRSKRYKPAVILRRLDRFYRFY